MRQFKSINQNVHLCPRVVHPKGRPAGRGNAKMLHQRAGAMLTCPDRDTFFVENGRDVMCMRLTPLKLVQAERYLVETLTFCHLRRSPSASLRFMSTGIGDTS